MGTSVPLSEARFVGDPARVIQGIIVHLQNDLPIVVDMEELPAGGDRTIRCTNVRTIDGKRPAFVHDRKSTFIFPLQIVRLIEVPTMSGSSSLAMNDEFDLPPAPEPVPALEAVDEEAEEDLLARIRQI